MTPSAAIATDCLTKVFRDSRGETRCALDQLSFECMPGEIFGLLGANGAGKTTAMRILSTVLKPTAGSASVAGCDVVLDPGGVRRKLGFLSANTGLYERMTAWEHVEYFARLHDLDGAHLEVRMETVFAALRMNDFRDRLVARLSTGMRQKVSIARAIVHDPPVLIFDEPTLGLDILVARNVLEQTEKLRAEGKCILYSTHVFREVERLCDRIAILHRGRMLAAGAPAALLAEHGSPDLEALFFNLVDRAESVLT
ncbi:MAG TPA: ATP-binding cassette domain-containing protein [Planctomycetia bacterium]|nr:ATP-binding cassette domain-containing protein [Planctomycetia bacterium]